MQNQDNPSTTDIRSVVREKYGSIARTADPTQPANCCGPENSSCCGSSNAQFSQVALLYETPDAMNLPPEVTNLSLGCGDPITLAELQPGQTVLDLGSGGGIDCFLAAQRVGAEGKVIGVDMTPEMIERARANQVKLGANNVEFRLGEIEHLPVADGTVDVVISNCVINLSPDKAQVFSEIYRALKPGGKIAVSDIVTQGPLPQEIKDSLSAWAGCVAGALDVEEYLEGIRKAGFSDVAVTPVYMGREQIEDAAAQMGLEGEHQVYDAARLEQTIFSAKITAVKR